MKCNMMILFSGKYLGEGSIYYSRLRFMYYLHLYPEDTDSLRQIVLKNPKMSLSCWPGPRGQEMGAISPPVPITESRFMALSISPLLAHTWKQTTHCSPAPMDEWMENDPSAFSPCFPAPCPELAASHPLLCVGFAVCWPGSRAKSSLLFSSWIICWLALKIYLDTGDSITGKTSKDLPKYSCVHV